MEQVEQKFGAEKKRTPGFNEGIWRVVEQVYIKCCPKSPRNDLTCHGGIAKLAQKLNICESTIRGWISGEKKVSKKYIPALIEISGGSVSPGDLRPEGI